LVDETYNEADVRTAVLPAVNGFATARDLAKIYAACVGDVDVNDCFRAARPGHDRFRHDVGLTDPAPQPLLRRCQGERP
jgi:hypothetical protein